MPHAAIPYPLEPSMSSALEILRVFFDSRVSTVVYYKSGSEYRGLRNSSVIDRPSSTIDDILVPWEKLSLSQVMSSEFLPAGPLNKCVNLKDSIPDALSKMAHKGIYQQLSCTIVIGMTINDAMAPKQSPLARECAYTYCTTEFVPDHGNTKYCSTYHRKLQSLKTARVRSAERIKSKQKTSRSLRPWL